MCGKAVKNTTTEQLPTYELVNELETRGWISFCTAENSENSDDKRKLDQREYDKVKKIRFNVLTVIYLLLASTIVWYQLDPERYRFIIFFLCTNYVMMSAIQSYIWDKYSELFGRDTH